MLMDRPLLPLLLYLVDLTWCKEKGCYTGTYKLGQEMKLVIEQCFTMLESMKITSTRIDIRSKYKWYIYLFSANYNYCSNDEQTVIFSAQGMIF